MNVSAWSIRNPIPSVLLFVMLTLLGLMGFQSMKIQNFPDIDLPTVSVTATLPGASPAQMETEVARKIENSVATLQGIKHIYTKTSSGTANVTVEFRLEKPTQEAVDDVRDAVSRIRADLPGDLRDPVISKMNLAGTPVLTYTIASSRMDEEALSWYVDHDVNKALLSVRGVGSVSRVGGVTREVRIEPDPEKLLALNASAGDISRQLRQVQQEASAAAQTLAGWNNRYAPSPPCNRQRNWRRWKFRSATAAACDWTSWPRCGTPSPRNAAPRCWTASRW